MKWRRENIWQIKRGQNVPGVKDSMRDDAEMSRRGRNLKGRETCKLLTLKSQGCFLLLNLPLFLRSEVTVLENFLGLQPKTGKFS